MRSAESLENSRVGVRARLATMWVVIMFFYLYNDVFLLLEATRSGEGPSADPPGELTMLIYATIITPSALMPLLCLVMPRGPNRLVNIVVGAAYFAIIVWTVLPADTAWFYRYIAVVENAVTLLVIWTALRWPRQELSS